MKKLIAIGMILLVLAAGCRTAQTDAPAPAPTEPPAAEQPTAAPASTPGPEAEATEPGEPYAFSFTAQTLDGADAKALLEENGCAFPCLDGQGAPGLMTGFLRKVSAIPTTLFFDSRGNQVGQWIVGVPRGSSVVDAYWNEIQARLDSLNGK